MLSFYYGTHMQLQLTSYYANAYAIEINWCIKLNIEFIRVYNFLVE